MEKIVLKADKRKIFGRKVKNLRRQGLLPANVYGKKVDSFSVEIKSSDFKEVYKKAGETSIVELELESKKLPVLIHNLQLHPVDDTILHVDLLQVDLKQKVTADIPVEVIGESPAEKQGLGTVVQYLDEIEVEALPGDLLDKFEIDATTLTDVDQAVSVKDLKYDKSKIEIKSDLEQIIVKVEPLRKEEEVVAPTVTEAETEVKEGEETAEKAEGDTKEETPKE